MYVRQRKIELPKDKGQLLTLSKYLVSIVFILLASPSFSVLFVSLLELAAIAFISNLLVLRYKKAGYAFNAFFLLLFNIQQLVLLFGRSFTTIVMVTNLDSLESLKGKGVAIAFGICILLCFTFLPIVPFPVRKGYNARWLSVILFMELVFTGLHGNTYSPLFALYGLGADLAHYRRQLEQIKNQPNVTASFYNPEIISVRQRPSTLPERPNVVLLFVEGLSQDIIVDSRGVMPHTQALQSQSVQFENYYNHTFATYRGLIGQLFSGYQLENYDGNTLVSIQDILAASGYQTTFINSEPGNTQFTSYLEKLRFQTVLTDPKKATGINKSLTDKAALELLYDTIEEQHATGQPFFTSMYTYGTHTTFDSADKRFEAGGQPVLNRFYNFDYYFGEFLEKFKQSEMAQNTILVFTTDHATYLDKDFEAAYPNHTRVNPDLDRIPFFIYHEGVQAETVNVSGRNSLSLAPTILDYIDISMPNYFLGQTLFFQKENNNSFDTVFYDTLYLLSTDYGEIVSMTETNEEIVRVLLQDYFAAKTQIPKVPE